MSQEGIEGFVDAIRLGEGAKQKLPAGLIPEAADQTAEAEAPKSEETPIVVEEVVEEAKVEESHDEL